MHFKKLIEAHRLFYGGYEHKAPFYDDYMRNKNWEEWSSHSVSIAEIEKLFRFVRSWDRFSNKTKANKFTVSCLAQLNYKTSFHESLKP